MKFCIGFAISILPLCILGCSPTTVQSLDERMAGQQRLEQQLAATESETLRARIDATLSDGLQSRRLSAETNAAWQIMHAVISYGEQLTIETSDRGLVGAVEYAFSGGQLMGFELLPGADILPATGRRGLKARLEPGSYEGQGHVDQWLAIFAMAQLPLDRKVQVGDEEFTLLDWARQAQYDASRNILDEFSWTLIALTHYFPEEPVWQAADGQLLSWEQLVEAELTYDIDASPCGGTHRLAGIVRALQAKQRLGLPDSAVWTRAQSLVEDSLEKAKRDRRANGGLSCFYFSRAGDTADLTGELASSGHVLEFVALALPAEELSAPWVELAANRLCDVLESTRSVELDCGALYHALNGLKIYRQRRWP